MFHRWFSCRSVATSAFARAALAPILLLSACGNGNQVAATDDGGATDLAQTPDLLETGDLLLPPPPPMPLLVPHSGKVFDQIHLVTITFTDGTHVDALERLGDFVFGSKWWKAVGEEYGITGGMHLQKVRLAEAAPNPLSDVDVETFIKARIMSGVLPPIDPQILYMVHFPPKTKLTDDTGAALCDSYEGYHYSASLGGKEFAYAVIGDCALGIDDVTNTVTHELIETATDPWNDPNAAWYLDPDSSDWWIAESGQESADLCEAEASAPEGGFAMAKSWSNIAAKAGTDPCVPAVGGVYRSVMVLSPSKVPEVAAGDTVTFVLGGWATGTTQPWALDLYDADSADLLLSEQSAVLSEMMMWPGHQVTLTLHAPANAKRGQLGGALVVSGDEQHLQPVAYWIK